MNKNIVTLKDLFIGGKMIAFIKGNRSVNSKNISRKKKSFEKFGMNLVPLMYVDGQKAVNDGCTLVHPITKEDIPDEEASKYVAIVEGQHRYTTAEETGLDEEKLSLCTRHFIHRNSKYLRSCSCMNVTAMRTLKRFSLKQTQLLTRGVVQIMLMARHYLIPKMSWQNLQKNLPI